MEYKVLKKIADLVIPLCFRLEVINKPELPSDEGAVIASNHIHALDPILISYAIYPQWLHHIAKKEIFDFPFLRPVMNWVGAIPLNRARPGTGMMKKAIKTFEKNEYLSIFPQGTRKKKEFGTIKKGATRLALMGQVPIYPVAITGLENVGFFGLLKRPKVRIIFGEPINTNGLDYNKTEIINLTKELEAKMKELYCKNRI